MKPELSTIIIGQPAHRALQDAGIETLEQLTHYSKKDLLALHGFGPKALGILENTLFEYGLSFKA